jgi:RNA polymerase sigma-70 factor, ECF subfamily
MINPNLGCLGQPLFNYADLSEALDENQANCRQLVSRARKRIDTEKDTLATPSRTAKKTLVAFAQAIRDADAQRMLALLKEDAVILGDGGGKALNALNPIRGADKISRFYMNVPKKFDQNSTFMPARINGAPGIVGLLYGKIVFVMTAVVDKEGCIMRILHMSNPDKLKRANASEN